MWITRVQEMDALQSITTHNLQAELRERTEQYNQLWLTCQHQADHIHGVAIPPSTLLGMTSHLPPAEVASIHPVIMHQQLQVYPNSASTLVLQSRLGQFQSIPAASPLQHGQNQQASTEVPQLPVVPVSKQAVLPDHSELHLRQGSDYSTVNISSAEANKFLPSQEKLQHISSQFDDALRLVALPQKSESEVATIILYFFCLHVLIVN